MHVKYVMRTILISDDRNLIGCIDGIYQNSDHQIDVYENSKDPLDVMSAVCESNPSLIIVDDDFLKPATVHILQSIRKVNRKIDIIFCTSDSSIDLGKEVSPLGIQYYAIKPLDEGELQDSFHAILNAQKKKNTHV